MPRCQCVSRCLRICTVLTLTYFRAGDVLDFQGAAQGTQGINSLKDGMDFGPKGEDGDSCAYESAVQCIGRVAVTVTCGMKSAASRAEHMLLLLPR